MGRYELIGLLATGGMAEIHLARLAGEAGFEKIVVVKRLLPELVASKAFVGMFLDEGKLVARLDHPNICEVHELGREGAEYFLVMPYLDGVAATELIAQPRDPDRVAQLRVATGVIAQARTGLHHAHELRDADGTPVSLVHRDVSPSNLFVTTKGVAKVLDFGIAKVRGATETEVGTVKGKTQYMAPEQLLGDALDRRADVFALGIVLYELATHQRLFKRASDYLAARDGLLEDRPRADEADPALPRVLAAVIAKALSRTPAERLATAHELAAALEAAMQPHGGVATAPQIAQALAEHHAEELTAQRTRQAKVVSSAAAKAPILAEQHPPTVAANKRALLEVAATSVKAAPLEASAEPAIDAATAPATAPTIEPGDVALATRARRRWIMPVLAGGGALAALVVVILTRGANESPRVAGGTASPADGPALLANGSATPAVGSLQANASPSNGGTVQGDGSASQTNGTVKPGIGVAPQANGAASQTTRAAGQANGVASQTNGASAQPKHSPGALADTNRAKKPDRHRIAAAGAQPGGLAVEVSAAQPSSGFFSIDARPYADIFVDGKPFGQTPLLHKQLAVGVHHLKAVRADGTTKTYDVTIRANATAAPIIVSW